MRNKTITVIFIMILAIFTIGQLSEAENLIGHNEDNVTKVYDNKDNYIFSIAMGITVGDRYISQDNVEYLIVKLEDEKAIAEKKGKIDLEEELTASLKEMPFMAVEKEKVVGIYHTHNDESYEPGSVSVEGRGDIHDVGRQLAKSLEKKRIETIYSDNMHLPHDGAAYSRSRATALSIVQKRPDIVLDLHRDAIPDVGDYTGNVNGKNITQIRLVVGRQNPNRKVNDQFARNLKAVSDKVTPGLIKDIFYGKGEYNQSIFPRAVLMEFGTYGNSQQQALDAASLLASPISYLLYGGKGSKPIGSDVEQKSAISSLFWIVVIFVAGLFAYLYYIEGSLQGVKDRIKKFLGRELVDRGDKK